MTEQTKAAISFSLIVGLGVALMLSLCWKYEEEPTLTIIYIQDPNYVQNIGEAQRRLKEQGLYHGKIDYIWGPKMEKAYCNYCGIKAIEGR